MAGQRQPIELVLAKGSKHLTKKRDRREEKLRGQTDYRRYFSSSVS